jgi:hypothetical protein
MLTVREDLDRDTFIKTQKPSRAMPGIKLMLMKSLPGMNWEYRDNLAMYSHADLRPLRLSITAEEWCGNNYLEWQAHGEKVSLLGRPYGDDIGHTNQELLLAQGYYLYEQLPMLVRVFAKQSKPITLRLVLPQTAYLSPHAEERVATLSRTGEEVLQTSDGPRKTAVVDLTVQGETPYFPMAERFWVDLESEVVWKMERNEPSTELGALHPNRAVYTLERVDRIAYWDRAVPPQTSSTRDRERATHSAWMAINLPRIFALRKASSFSLEEFVQKRGEDLPREYLSSPEGNKQIAKTFDGTGGWWFNPNSIADGKPGRFEPNVAPKP